MIKFLLRGVLKHKTLKQPLLFLFITLLAQAAFGQPGSLDASFNSSGGADDIVYALALQSDGKVLIGGNL